MALVLRPESLLPGPPPGTCELDPCYRAISLLSAGTGPPSVPLTAAAAATLAAQREAALGAGARQLLDWLK
jgi:hypothetical protein